MGINEFLYLIGSKEGGDGFCWYELWKVVEETTSGSEHLLKKMTVREL